MTVFYLMRVHHTVHLLLLIFLKNIFTTLSQLYCIWVSTVSQEIAFLLYKYEQKTVWKHFSKIRVIYIKIKLINLWSYQHISHLYSSRS